MALEGGNGGRRCRREGRRGPIPAWPILIGWGAVSWGCGPASLSDRSAFDGGVRADTGRPDTHVQAQVQGDAGADAGGRLDGRAVATNGDVGDGATRDASGAKAVGADSGMGAQDPSPSQGDRGGVGSSGADGGDAGVAVIGHGGTGGGPGTSAAVGGSGTGGRSSAGVPSFGAGGGGGGGGGISACLGTVGGSTGGGGDGGPRIPATHGASGGASWAGGPSAGSVAGQTGSGAAGMPGGGQGGGQGASEGGDGGSSGMVAGDGGMGASGRTAGSGGTGAVQNHGDQGGEGDWARGDVGGTAGGSGGSSRTPDLTPPGVGELRITELLINPAGTDTGREWIEIQNASGRALDLSRLHLADRLNDAAVDWGLAVPRLDIGACAVLLQSADPTKNGGIAVTGAGVGLGAGAGAGGGGPSATVLGSFGTRVSLNNDMDTISLCVGPCGAGTQVDRVEWDSSLGPDYDGHALSRDERGRVCPATEQFGDAGSFGTPGAPNPLCP